MRIQTTSILACGLALSACSLYFEQDPPAPDGGPGGPGSPAPDPCELLGSPDIPGYPFDIAYYQQVIWPMTQRACGLSGCHAPVGGPDGGFRVWPSDGASCGLPRSFNQVFVRSELNNFPEDSELLRQLDGRDPGHPLLLGPGWAEYDLLLGYIQDAWFTNRGGRRPGLAFDVPYFEAQIQPMLDAAGCSVAGCHDITSTWTVLGLYPFPATGSTRMLLNLEAVADFVDFVAPPGDTALFQYATNRHGGTGVVDPDALLAWIQAAYDAGY